MQETSQRRSSKLLVNCQLDQDSTQVTEVPALKYVAHFIFCCYFFTPCVLCSRWKLDFVELVDFCHNSKWICHLSENWIFTIPQLLILHDFATGVNDDCAWDLIIEPWPNSLSSRMSIEDPESRRKSTTCSLGKVTWRILLGGSTGNSSEIHTFLIFND